MVSRPLRGRLTVFEAFNDCLKEIYISATIEPMFLAMARIAKYPPSAIRHWDASRHRRFQSVAFHLTGSQAGRLIKLRLEAPRDGWARLTDRDALRRLTS
jgi:hypothetical protein